MPKKPLRYAGSLYIVTPEHCTFDIQSLEA